MEDNEKLLFSYHKVDNSHSVYHLLKSRSRPMVFVGREQDYCNCPYADFFLFFGCCSSPGFGKRKNMSETQSETDLGEETLPLWTIIWIVAGILYGIAFVLCMIALVASYKKPLFLWWYNHIVCFLFLGPFSLITSSIEIHRQRTGATTTPDASMDTMRILHLSNYVRPKS